MSKFYAYIKGLSNKQNDFISKYIMVSNPNTVMIPYTSDILNIIDEIKEVLPTEYIVGNVTYQISNLKYIIKNDYIIITLM